MQTSMKVREVMAALGACDPEAEAVVWVVSKDGTTYAGEMTGVRNMMRDRVVVMVSKDVADECR